MQPVYILIGIDGVEHPSLVLFDNLRQLRVKRFQLWILCDRFDKDAIEGGDCRLLQINAYQPAVQIGRRFLLTL